MQMICHFWATQTLTSVSFHFQLICSSYQKVNTNGQRSIRQVCETGSSAGEAKACTMTDSWSDQLSIPYLSYYVNLKVTSVNGKCIWLQAKKIPEITGFRILCSFYQCWCVFLTVSHHKTMTWNSEQWSFCTPQFLGSLYSSVFSRCV